MKDRRLEELVEEGRRALVRGETLEAFLARYPLEAAELQPLLEIGQRLTGLCLNPSHAFRHEARERFLQATLRARQQREEQPLRWRRWLWRVTLPVGTAVLLLGAGAGLLTVSADALPGSPFYAIQKARYGIVEHLARTPGQQAAFQLNYVAHDIQLVKRAQALGIDSTTIVFRLEISAMRASERANQLAQRLPPRKRALVIQRLHQLLLMQERMPISTASVHSREITAGERMQRLEQLERVVEQQSTTGRYSQQRALQRSLEVTGTPRTSSTMEEASTAVRLTHTTTRRLEQRLPARHTSTSKRLSAHTVKSRGSILKRLRRVVLPRFLPRVTPPSHS